MNVSIEKIEFTAKSAVDAYVLLGACFGMPAILAALVMWLRPDVASQWLPVFAIGLLVTAFVYIWLGAFRLRVTGGEIVYRTLFSGEKRVWLSQITSATRVLEFNPWTHWGKPRNRLEIFTGESADAPELCINLKIFRKREIALLLDLLPTKMVN